MTAQGRGARFGFAGSVLAELTPTSTHLRS